MTPRRSPVIHQLELLLLLELEPPLLELRLPLLVLLVPPPPLLDALDELFDDEGLAEEDDELFEPERYAEMIAAAWSIVSLMMLVCDAKASCLA